ncbi:hypothetical protein [Oerskovia enterophila]|uniref:hypothetical protein n=1 Tax=Oerskovia enterophila TaxID=43678 RepID=UPI00380D1186
MTDTAARRKHAALALAHRWFAFLETDWGNTPDHMTMFEPAVTLTGHHGGVTFAHSHESLQRWFEAVPDATSAHHMLHAVWSEAGAGSGGLSFVVAYQTPTLDGVAGAIIKYDTVITFRDGQARFVALDKTPVLPDTDPVYQPSWAAHRVGGLIHSALANPKDQPIFVAALGPLTSTADVKVWAPSSAPASSYTAYVTIRGQNASPRTVRIALLDNADATHPTVSSIDAQ